MRSFTRLGLLLALIPTVAVAQQPTQQASKAPVQSGAAILADAGCACEVWEPEEAARRATLVFVGEAQFVYENGTAVFMPSAYMKGMRTLRPTISLNRPGGDPKCEAKFSPQGKYAVFAMGNFDDGYYTDACLQRQLNESDDQQRQVAQILGPVYHEAEPLVMKLRMEPSDLVSAQKLADVYTRGNDPEPALGQYTYLAELATDPLPYYMGQGEAMLRLGPSKAKDALGRFDDVLEKQPDNQQAWRGRFRALALLERWSELPLSGANVSQVLLTHTAMKAELHGLNLSESILEDFAATGSNLPGLDLTATSVRRADFRNTVLTQAVFKRVRLSQSDFSGADLSGADISFSRLLATSFRGANLEGANFTGAQLDGVDLTGSNLKGAKLQGVSSKNVIWPKGFQPPAP